MTKDTWFIFTSDDNVRHCDFRVRSQDCVNENVWTVLNLISIAMHAITFTTGVYVYMHRRCPHRLSPFLYNLPHRLLGGSASKSNQEGSGKKKRSKNEFGKTSSLDQESSSSTPVLVGVAARAEDGAHHGLHPLMAEDDQHPSSSGKKKEKKSITLPRASGSSAGAASSGGAPKDQRLKKPSNFLAALSPTTSLQHDSFMQRESSSYLQQHHHHNSHHHHLHTPSPSTPREKDIATLFIITPVAPTANPTVSKFIGMNSMPATSMIVAEEQPSTAKANKTVVVKPDANANNNKNRTKAQQAWDRNAEEAKRERLKRQRMSFKRRFLSWRPKSVEDYVFWTTLFFFVRIISSTLSIVGSALPDVLLHFIHDITFEIGFTGLALYLIGTVYSTPAFYIVSLPNRFATSRTVWRPSEGYTNALGMTLCIGPVLVNFGVVYTLLSAKSHLPAALSPLPPLPSPYDPNDPITISNRNVFQTAINVQYMLWGGVWCLALSLAFLYFGSKLVRILKMHLAELRADHEVRKASVGVSGSGGSGAGGSRQRSGLGGLNASAGDSTSGRGSEDVGGAQNKVSGTFGSSGGGMGSFAIREATANIRRLELGVIRITGMKWTNMVIMFLFSVILIYYGAQRVQFHTSSPDWWQYFVYCAAYFNPPILVLLTHFYIILGSVPIEVEPETDESDDGDNDSDTESIHTPPPQLKYPHAQLHLQDIPLTPIRPSLSLSPPSPAVVASAPNSVTLSPIHVVHEEEEEEEEEDVGLQKMRNGVMIVSDDEGDVEGELEVYEGGWRISEDVRRGSVTGEVRRGSAAGSAVGSSGGSSVGGGDRRGSGSDVRRGSSVGGLDVRPRVVAEREEIERKRTLRFAVDA
ncbi:hypothetical protein HDU97_006121 [Phlyctochytrium planicorne]|nr:hypothetical protein HDU97_006121 [Phlyctochytrium planicorne]